MKNYSILVVDDEWIIGNDLKENLESVGYKATLALNGEEAVEILKNSDYDLIITDIIMPIMDGLEVLKKARELNKDAVVLIITGHGAVKSAIEALRLGAADYMLKPYDKTEMFLRVENCLKKLDLHRREQRLHKELVESYDNSKITGKARETFFHMIVHDLKGPLSNLLSAIMLLDDNSASEDKEFSTKLNKSMRKSIVTMLSLIEGILDISRLEANEMPVSIKTINVAEFAKEFYDQSKLQAKASNRRLLLDCKWNNIQAPADSELLFRVMQNIFSNALKYGSKETEIGIYVNQIGEDAIISISNEGSLIPDEYKTRIFEKYFQIENNKLKRFGAGIGLAFCKLAIETMGGKIWVEDENEKRLSFKIALKL